jgi:predicted amidohydrolase
MGEVLAEADDRQQVLLCDVDPAAVQQLRALFPFLNDRRPQAYRR